MLSVPCRILIGPLFNPEMLGKYRHDPNIRLFMPRSVFTERYAYDCVYDPHQVKHFNQIFDYLPKNWEPELVIWWDPVYQAMPPGIEDCPYPTALIPGDWNLAFLTVLQAARSVDGVFADARLEPILRQAGIQNIQPWMGFAYDPHLIWREPVERIHDICFIGNMNPQIHPVRSRYLAQILPLQSRYKLFFKHGIWGDAYRQALNQSRIVFNYTICQVMNMRAFEAPAAGALLFIEADNREVGKIFRDQESCVLYTAENLEERLLYYLDHETERSQIAERGYKIAQNYTWEKQFERLLIQIPALLDNIVSSRLVLEQAAHLRHVRALNQLSASNANGAHLAAPHLESLRISFVEKGLSVERILELNALVAMLFPYVDESHEIKSAYTVSLVDLGAWIDAALALTPRQPILHYHRGLIAEYTGNETLAAWSFAHCIELMAQGHLHDLELWRDFILPFNKAGRGTHPLAFAWEEHSYLPYEHQPEDVTALLSCSIWQRIAHLMLKQGKKDKAKIAYENAYTNYAEPSLLVPLARIALEQNDHEKAFSLFQQILKQQPFLIQHLIPLIDLSFLLKYPQELQAWASIYRLIFSDLKQLLFLSHLVCLGQGKDSEFLGASYFDFVPAPYFYAWLCQILQYFEQSDTLKPFQYLRQVIHVKSDLFDRRVPPIPLQEMGFIESISAELTWIRPWQEASQAHWSLDLRDFPLAFAEPSLQSTLPLEDLQPYCLGILSDQRDLKPWLEGFALFNRLHPEYTLVLWSPQNQISLAQVESLLNQCEGSVAWWDEPLLAIEEAAILSHAQVILGNPRGMGLYYGIWALYLGQVLFWSQEPEQWPYSEPYSLQIQTWECFFEDFKDWIEQQKYSVQKLHTYLKRFHEQESAALWRQALWKKRLLQLVVS